MSAYVLGLDEIKEQHREVVGGKALPLAQMRQAGFDVPPGFCITAQALRAFAAQPSIASALDRLAASDLCDTDRAQSIRAALRAAPMPEDVLRAVRSAYDALGGGAVAVRSSALHEDQATASFAGQYDTYLNLSSLDEMIESIKGCWASLWNERAITYRRRALATGEINMGVIVQRQVPAQVSGTLFTLNPLTGREEEMAIEASWGLGEGVVSGRVSPDHYVIDIWNERVLERHVSEKQVMIVPAPGSGVREVPVPEDDRQRAVLSDADLMRLAERGVRVQELFGRPQDIEWALHESCFYILQSRPLTSYSFAPGMGQWTSANFREVMPGLVNPLSFTINLQYEWGLAMDEFFSRMKMQPDNKPVLWGRTFFGRAYWNVGEVKRRAAIVPGFKERAFDATVGIEPTYGGDGHVTPVSLPTLLRALPVLVALQRMYKSVWREADAEKHAFLREEEALMAIDPAALDDEELEQQVRHVLQLHHRVNRVALMVSFLSTQSEDDFHVLVETLNKGLPPSEQVAMGDLLTGLGQVRTARPLLDLWELSRRAVAQAEVASIIRSSETPDMLRFLETSEAGRAFAQDLRAYLDRYGYMASADEDLSAPRWSEDATFVLSTLKSFVIGGIEEDPEAILARQQAVMQREKRRVRDLLNRNLVNRLLPFRKGTFLQGMLIVRRYCWWREEIRDTLSRAHYQCHRFLTELGRRWAARGLTGAPQDVFFLTLQQFLATLDGSVPLEETRRWIRKHRSLATRYRSFVPPDTVGRGARLDERLPAPAPGRQVHAGVGCSPGTASGPARIVTSLADAGRLRKGDILIAPYTNPGWTPLFSLAAAVVMEEGGLLSHGAVVARECGVPAVLRIKGATRLFHDGQTLRVDGGRGTVEVM